MERRVIKFNLVGAIFVLILIIAVIVGIVIFAVREGKDEGENSDEGNNSSIQLNAVA